MNLSSIFQPTSQDSTSAALDHHFQQIGKRRRTKESTKAMADDDEEPGVDVNGAGAAATAIGGHGSTPAALSTQPGHGQAQSGEIMFTTSQVRSIVASAVAEKEASLCAHYDMILAARLEEQFNLFTKFNEDHIHQKLSQSQHMYMS